MAKRNLRATLTSGNQAKATLSSGSGSNITIRSGAAPTQRLDALVDVVELESQKVDGAILVYDADTDRYILRDILNYDTESDVYKLDGGDF